MGEPRFERLAIVGVGLIGGAVGLAARKAGVARKVVGYCRRREAAREAVGVGAVEECPESLAQAARGADFVVLATGPDPAARLAAQIAEGLAPGAVATDVAGVKHRVVAECSEAFGRRARFVGSHPLAGSEKRGAAAAAEVKLAGSLCVVTPARATDPEALALVRGFWESLGMRVAELPPEEHDARLARTSHLPHFLSAALAGAIEDRDAPFCAAGFRDVTRLAAGDPGLWTEIAMHNRRSLAAELYRVSRRLHDLADVLTSGEREAVQRFLESGRDRRREIAGEE